MRIFNKTRKFHSIFKQTKFLIYLIILQDLFTQLRYKTNTSYETQFI